MKAVEDDSLRFGDRQCQAPAITADLTVSYRNAQRCRQTERYPLRCDGFWALFGQGLDSETIVHFYSEGVALGVRRRCVSTPGEAERFNLLPTCKGVSRKRL